MMYSLREHYVSRVTRHYVPFGHYVSAFADMMYLPVASIMYSLREHYVFASRTLCISLCETLCTLRALCITFGDIMYLPSASMMYSLREHYVSVIADMMYLPVANIMHLAMRDS